MSDAFVNIWGSFLENFWYLIVFGYGAIVGSFLNVLIYRMPLGMSLSKPASHCPNCNHLLGFWDNIPLFAFLALGGRCRYCRVPISWRYFGVELVTACLWTALFHQVADRNPVSWVSFLAEALFVSILVAVIFIDLDHFIIPDELNWFGIALGVVRDVACIALAWKIGAAYILPQTLAKYAFFNVLPRSIPGALLYGGALYAVSFGAFLFYARGETESLASAARRFFTFEDLPEDEEAASAEASEIAPEPAAALPADSEAPAGDAPAVEEERDAVRLAFSPAFLALVSALVLIPVLRWWAALVFLLPFAAFVLLTKRQGEETGVAAARFFRSNDLGSPVPTPLPPPAEDDDLPLLPGDERLKDPAFAAAAASLPADLPPDPPADPATAPLATAPLTAAEEADQFAIEAESGRHGGMGLGDVKLALAIGAVLGPGAAMISLFFATASGAIAGLVLARLHGRSLKLAIPFGPFMAFGALVMLLYGDQLIDWYVALYAPKR